jgi:hypothetical protein
MERHYRICLADYEPLLIDLSQILGAKYLSGAYTLAEEQFQSSFRSQETWALKGQQGILTIEFEKYEGYYFSEFRASEPEFTRGAQFLWQSYLAQGGDPNAQERP